jgi:predicted dehydrogenase
MAKKSTTAIPTITSDEPRPLRIGLIGYGFMGRAHANAIRQVPHFFRDISRALRMSDARRARRVVERALKKLLQATEDDDAGLGLILQMTHYLDS